MDLAASNWGRNTPYQRFRGRPLRIYYGDWTGTGRLDLMEAYYEDALGKYVPFQTLDQLREETPALAAKFPTFASYAETGIAEILGTTVGTPSMLEVNWLENTVFLNRGDHFEAVPLPHEAQFAPSFGVSVGDFDGDGCEDLVLAQNFFGVEAETPRYDAGRGLLLKGNGQGGFEASRGQESGIVLYGEQRGCALADFDGDGRLDIAIGQNNGSTGLFRNVAGAPGLRVRLHGPAANPDALGAIVRLQYGERYGPARLVHAGSGYWSQDSVVQVMGRAGTPTHVWVQWPGGAVSTRPVPSGASEIVVVADEPGSNGSSR
jgi:hypothetical protein